MRAYINRRVFQAFESSPVVLLVVTACSSANRSTFSHENLMSAGLSSAYMDIQNCMDAILCEQRSYVLVSRFCFCPKMTSETTSELLISWRSMPPDLPSLLFLCMHTYTSDTHVTPLLKILAMSLVLTWM